MPQNAANNAQPPGSSEDRHSANASFPCPGCGGSMVFDSASQNLKCRYCGAEQTIDQLMEQAVERSLDDGHTDPEQLDWGTAQQAVKCEACGGESLVPGGQTSLQCAFCGSPKVLPQSNAGSLRPETLIPFQVSSKEAEGKFKAWKKKRWFLPNVFKKQDVGAKLHGIYIPYWTYDTDTYSVYSAEVGIYHYRTVTKTRTVNGKTETYTDRERYTVWHWTRGDYDRFFDDILIPASGYYDTPLLEKLGDFDLSKLTGYQPQYLSGFIAERYSVSRQDGWKKAQAQAESALESDIRRQIGGDEIRHLKIRTRYSGETYKHMLLPVWNAAYKYKNKTYRYMVNGQTGKVSGRVPRSAAKITAFVLFWLAVVAVAIWFFAGSGADVPQ